MAQGHTGREGNGTFAVICGVVLCPLTHLFMEEKSVENGRKECFEEGLKDLIAFSDLAITRKIVQ